MGDCIPSPPQGLPSSHLRKPPATLENCAGAILYLPSKHNWPPRAGGVSPLGPDALVLPVITLIGLGDEGEPAVVFHDATEDVLNHRQVWGV